MPQRKKPLKSDAQALDIFQKFWKPLVCDSRGRVDRVKLARELADYKMILGFTSKVYDHITGGLISKPNTLPEVVIQVATDVENEALQSVLADEKATWAAQIESAAPDVAYVKLGGKAVTLDDGRHIRVCVPEGEFMCVYDRANNELLVDDKHPLPYEWRETALEAAATLTSKET